MLNEPKNIAIIILAVAVLGLIYLQFGSGQTGMLSANEASEAALAYINNTLLGGQMEAVISGDVLEENGLYKFDLEVSGQQFTSYITKDGQLFFPEGIKIEPAGEEENGEVDTTAACSAIVKTEPPKLEAFVVSYCPYGLQMQRILAEVAKEAPELEKYINIRYIGAVVDGKVTAMHGQEEADENLRQICIREEQNDLFFNYISCFMQAGETEICLAEAGIDETELNSCMADADRGAAYGQNDFDAQNVYGVTGSPTLFVNGQKASEFDFGGRTAEAVKDLLCCGFPSEMIFCDVDLTTESAASGFSETYNGSAGSSGSCD